MHKRIHASEKSICNNSSLNSHGRIDPIEKTFKCDFFVKTFSPRKYLIKHRRIRTGERPYICDICELSFIHGKQLSRYKKSSTHMNRVETNFVDCWESIKVEDIKEELYEEVIDEDDILNFQEINDSGDEKKSTFVGDVEIV